MNNSTQSKNNPTHSAPIMYLYPYKATKRTSSRGESACLCAVSLSAVSAMRRCTGGLVKNGFADLNTQRAQVVLSHSQGVVKMTTPYQLNKHKK